MQKPFRNDLESRNRKSQAWVIGFLVACFVLCLAFRWLPVPENFSPIGALLMIVAVSFSSFRHALIFGLASILFFELLLTGGAYPGFTWNALCLLLYVGVGRLMISERSLSRSFLGLGLGSLTFFVSSNFGVWLFSGLYPMSFLGLVEAYTLAIPFAWNTLLADLSFGGLFVMSLKLASSLGAWKLPYSRWARADFSKR